MLDRLVLLSAAVVPGLVFFVAFGFRDSMRTIGLVIMGLGMLSTAAYQWGLVARTGQSLGKKWVGVRIVLEDGAPPGFWRGVVLRQWCLGALSLGVVQLAPYLGSLVVLTDLLLIFGAERQCLHDMIARTIVVRDSPDPS